MVIGYKIYQDEQVDKVLGGVVQVAYEIIMEGKKFDLIELLRDQLMMNLRKIKK